MARQTADIVLEAEDLRSVLAAVAEGRVVQDNLRRSVRFLMATNLSEIVLVVAGSLLGRELLSPLQLLWINLLTDTLPALALALEPGDADVLDRPPAPPDAPILAARDWRRVARDGAAIAGVAGAAALAGGPGAALATLAATQLGYGLACRAPTGVPTARFAGFMGARSWR
jgi:Ca2+-transporting ATPase